MNILYLNLFQFRSTIFMRFAAFCFLIFTGISAALGDEPLAVFLTWKEDPTTSMVIDWHDLKNENSSFFYKAKDGGKWQEVKSENHLFPYSDRVIHRVTLNGLKPATSYDIKVGDSDVAYYFNTMPLNTDKPIKIAIGGDAMHSKKYMEKTNIQVLKHDPHFVIIGGDLAYANGKKESVGKWYDWFDAWKTLLTEDNRLIPVVVAIGNHEVINSSYSKHEGFQANDQDREKIAPYFYKLFAFPGHPGYNALDFGNYLRLIILDSDHTNSVIGEQTRWLAEQLESSKSMLHTIPIYHVAAFPSVRPFDNGISKRIRENWVPLFEKHSVKVAFENHDHAYKRTFPIKNNKIDIKGTVYIGDGAWGTNPRETHKVEETWYLKKASSIRHFIIMTIQGENQSMEMIDEDGRLIDTFSITEN